VSVIARGQASEADAPEASASAALASSRLVRRRITVCAPAKRKKNKFVFFT